MKKIKLTHIAQAGPCLITDCPGTDGVVMNIGSYHLFICDKHALKLKKQLKKVTKKPSIDIENSSN